MKIALVHDYLNQYGGSLRSLKPSGFNISATGKLPFSRPLSPTILKFSRIIHLLH